MIYSPGSDVKIPICLKTCLVHIIDKLRIRRPSDLPVWRSQRQCQMVVGTRSAAFAKVKCHLEQEKGIPAGGSRLNTCAVAFMAQNKHSHCQSAWCHSQDPLTNPYLHPPSCFALIEWILYGIQALSVRIVSNLNQKIKLLHHCSCKLLLFTPVTAISICNIFHYNCWN